MEQSDWFLEGYLEPQGQLERVAVRPMPFRMGRQHALELPLRELSVSATHAEIVRERGRLVLHDLGSRNGTFVNGNKIEAPVALRNGDVIHLGQCELRVVCEVLDLGDTMAMTMHAESLPHRLVTGVPELRELLASRAVVPFFQPIVRLDNGEVIAYEVLGRGTHDGLSPSPYELFHIAEAAGLEGELSRLFRVEGIRIGVDAHRASGLFVNTHPAEMDDAALLPSLRRARSEAPDSRLTLEIHEGAVTDVGRMRALRAELEELDVGLAYDDFGAGQARLLELVEVPPDYLKFDISLIRGLHRATAGKQRMVEVLVHMVNELGIPALAEGVEEEDEAVACRQMGFTYAQGYHFGRPAPADN